MYVPVRPGPSGCAARLFRTPLGARTAVGFTSEHRLIAMLGPGQAWVRLAEPALRALTTPLGVTTVTVDPHGPGSHVGHADHIRDPCVADRLREASTCPPHGR
nr:SAV_915 family protein [Streptomyces sp. SID1328]